MRNVKKGDLQGKEAEMREIDEEMRSYIPSFMIVRLQTSEIKRGHTYTHTHRHTDTQTHRHTDTQTDRHTHGQSDQQTE